MEAAPQRMDQIFQTIQDSIGGFFGNPIVQLAIQALVVYFVILWLAAAYWAFRDMQQRSENPVLPYLAAALIVLFTPLLFVFGIIVYRIIRPHEKIGEVYERNLAEEALLAEVEAIKTCPQCRRRVNDEWIICPTCRTQLSRVCANCGRLVGLDWALCAWCGRDFERSDLAAYESISTQLPARLEPSATRLEPTAPPQTSQTPRTARVRQPPSAGRSAPGTIPEP
jgi:RNA polymerase subunit RPABC4/transcription elongation factor Spt4